ncbi:MAG: flagellar hook-basal body complex protein [Pikeienuella sp.]
MDDSFAYLAVNRQRGLRTELSTIANNLANMATTGFRREGLVFAEFVVGRQDAASLSMADLQARFFDQAPGEIRMTGAPLDLAIAGEGFFALEFEEGLRLTRAGHFARSPEGLMVSASGRPVLDLGNAPIFLPPEGEVTVATDGTVSVDGVAQAQIGLFTAPPDTMTRDGEASFRIEGEPIPAEASEIIQGALEGSNIDAISEIARMIEVSRAYQRAQDVLVDDNDRIRATIERLGQPV